MLPKVGLFLMLQPEGAMGTGELQNLIRRFDTWGMVLDDNKKAQLPFPNGICS